LKFWERQRVTLARMVRRIPPVPGIALVVGLCLTVAYGWLLDDAFIYFRYADNAAVLGAGLVYNEGEYVEGYTSPLWMTFLLAVRAVHLRYWPVILAVGLASMTASWWLALRVNRRFSPLSVAQFDVPALWIVSCYAVQSHFTSGLETPLVQVFALAFAALILEPEAGWLQLLVALGPLVRPELNLAFMIAAGWCGLRLKSVPWRLLGAGVLSQSLWLAFRVYYYADLVPNTFHLKDTVATGRGLHYVHDTLRAYYLYWLFGIALVLICVAVARRRGGALQLPARFVLWSAALVHTAYVIRIGGDFVHYRYMAFPVLVTVASIGGLIEPIAEPLTRLKTWGVSAASLAFVCLILLSYPAAQLPAHPLLLHPRADTLRMYRVDGVEDAASHRGRFDLSPSEWDLNEVTGVLEKGKLEYRWATATGWCRDGYEHLDWFIVQY
jgi:arabinofuranosyltransferase